MIAVPDPSRSGSLTGRCPRPLAPLPPDQYPGKSSLPSYDGGAGAVWPVVTLVLWLSCLLVGGVGLVLRYEGPGLAPEPALPTVAELLHVELTTDPSPAPGEAPASVAASVSPPPLAPSRPVPAAPALAAVVPVRADPAPPVALAVPSPAPVFPVAAGSAPTTVAPAVAAGPTGSAPAGSTELSQPAGAAVGTGTAVESLVLGRGEGKQPAPEYPSRARRAGQEGTVRVQFLVGEEGRVREATVAAPCPWPLLNDAAVRVVRERWNFRPGPRRRYEVAIRFELRD